MEVYEYLNQVEKQIRQEAVREEIRTELRQHIEDQADFYQESGMSRKEAVERAVADMGDPVETGVQLDMVHQPQLDKKLLISVAILLIVEAGFQIIYYIRVEERPFVFSSVAMSLFALINFFWMLMYAKRSFFSQKFHKTSTWLGMWLTIAVLAAFFKGMEFVAVGNSARNSPEAFQRMACMIATMLPALYGGLVFGWREKKKGFAVLLAIFGVDLLLGFLLGGGIYMALFILEHMVLLTMGIRKNWYGEKSKKLLGEMWILALVLFIAGTFMSFEQYRNKYLWKTNLQNYLVTPDLPGILRALTGEYFGLSICICAVLLLGFFLWILLDIRKLTNDLCRMLCVGIFCGFFMQTLYSLICLGGMGQYEYVFFPILSVWYSGTPVMVWYHYWFLGIFLNCHKSDRIIPKKMK